MLPLATPRLTLRVIQPADAPVLTEYRNDPVVAGETVARLTLKRESRRAPAAAQLSVTGRTRSTVSVDWARPEARNDVGSAG